MAKIPQAGDVIEVWHGDSLLGSSWSMGETEAHYYMEINLGDWFRPVEPSDLRIVHKVDGNIESEHNISVRTAIKSINIPTQPKENYVPDHLREKWLEILEGMEHLYDDEEAD